MIKQAIKDLANERWRKGAERYILSPDFPKHCEVAGYPDVLLDSLKDIMSQSSIQRRYLSKQAVKALEEYEE